MVDVPDDIHEVSFIVHEMNIGVPSLATIPCFDIAGDTEDVIASMEHALTEEGYIHERHDGKLLILGQTVRETTDA